MTALERALSTSEIILTILYNYVDDVNTLLAIRHTCSAWFNVTTAYEKSISQVIAARQFPKAKRLLDPNEDGKQYTISWLIQLIPRQLAAILVDRHRVIGDTQMFGIPADDPIGDPLRIRVANGFRVMHRLSLISQYVHYKEFPTAHSVDQEVQPQSKMSRRLSRSNSGLMKIFSSPDLTLSKRRETVVYERRKEYVQSLSSRDREDYQIMSIFLIGCFEHLWSPPTSMAASVPDGPLDFGSPPRRWIGRKDSWANWYILHHGPMVFWEQWWANRSYPGRASLFRKMEATFAKRSRNVMNNERDFAQKIEKDLLKGIDPRRYNPPPELMGYQHRWDEGTNAKIRHTVPRDTLGCVAFRVDEVPPPVGMHRDCWSASNFDNGQSECVVMTHATTMLVLRDR